MKILNEYPPNIEAIQKVFTLHDRVVFTYGNTLYNPGGWPVTSDLIEHEVTHVRQQKNDPEGWWARYLGDASFRLEQELEAYRNQWKSLLRGNNKDKFLILDHMARELSGEIYGNIISFTEAKRRIMQWD